MLKEEKTVAKCKRCNIYEGFGEDFEKTLTDYIQTIEDELKVTQEIYSMRLNKCDACEGLKNGVCRYCGCFVNVRAIKKHMNCPKPKNDEWDFESIS